MDRPKSGKPEPRVAVVRRQPPTGAVATRGVVRPGRPPPPSGPAVVPRSATPAVPRPAVPRPPPPSAPRVERPVKGFARRPPTGPPPTSEQIQALARREHVPTRIARGELEGKMNVRIWRKLHKEEATRFDEAYALMEKFPVLPLADAFGCIQSGMAVEEFLGRRGGVQKKVDVKAGRAAVNAGAIDAFIGSLVASSEELVFVLAERALPDKILGVQPQSFQLAHLGRLEKLQVVTVAKNATWGKWQTELQLERDPKRAHAPRAVARQPARRPISDPRPFLEHLGHPVKLVLRNGLILKFPLRAVGPFDVLCGPSDDEVFFVPLHAMVEWDPVD